MSKDFADEVLRQSPYPMVRLILVGTSLVALALLTLLIASSLMLNNSYVNSRILAGVFIVVILGLCFVLLRKGHYQIVAWVLASLYAGVSSYILLSWSINAPVGVLMLGLVITLSGIMLGSKVIIPVAAGTFILLFTLHLLHSFDYIEVDTTSLALESSFGDVLTYGAILGVFSLLTSLSRSQMESSLKNALAAEDQLEQERNQLAIRVKDATESLREAQLKEIQQLYRFAELGQLTALTLHELANHLSVLTLDMDDINEKYKNSIAIKNAKESISYIDELIKRVRGQLKDDAHSKKFDAIESVYQTVKYLSPKVIKTGLHLKVVNKTSKKSFYVFGDSMRLSQSIIILVNNALDASLKLKKDDQRDIIIKININENNLNISVVDKGIGIPDSKRKMLFEPLNSSKKNGLGIGLFITKQIIETHFKGSISIEPTQIQTEFVVRLPRFTTTSRR